MDNMITGVLSVAIFAAFTAGLAESIGEAPFVLIVGVVLLMVVIDLSQSVKEGFAEKKEKKNGEG